MKRAIRLITIPFLALTLVLTLAACGGEDEVRLAEGDWESNEFHNQVAKLIIEEGYGVPVSITQADTPVITQSIINGDLDVNLEMWSGNVPSYEDDIANGRYEEVSVNFDDNYQGLYIPQYLQDEHPELTSVQDLPEYKHLFPDPEVNNWDAEEDKALVYGGPSGWAATAFLQNKFDNKEDYGELIEHFDFRPIESTATLNSTLMSAYQDEEAWVGYNWEPTWILGQLDLVLLEDDLDFVSASDEGGRGNLPPQDVTVIITSDFRDRFPEVTDFLSNYETSSALTSEALAYMQDHDDAEPRDAAIYFLNENESLWTTWVPEDVVANVKSAIE